MPQIMNTPVKLRLSYKNHSNEVPVKYKYLKIHKTIDCPN
jgi:hypothetical protein